MNMLVVASIVSEGDVILCSKYTRSLLSRGAIFQSPQGAVEEYRFDLSVVGMLCLCEYKMPIFIHVPPGVQFLPRIEEYLYMYIYIDIDITPWTKNLL